MTSYPPKNKESTARRSGRLQSIPPPTVKALSLQGLRQAVPAQYSEWVRSAVLMCVLGYAVISLTVVLDGTQEALYRKQEFYALGISLLALLLERRGRPMGAAYLMLSAVSIEACISFYGSADGIRAAALPALPVVVMGSGLFLGPRAGYAFAVGMGSLVPSLVWLAGQNGTGPGFVAHDALYVAALGVSLVATAFVLHVFLRSFGHVLARSEANERRAADLLEAASDGLIVVAPNETIEASNDHASTALGLSREELRGRGLGSLGLRAVGSDGAAFDFEGLSKKVVPLEFESERTGRALEAQARPVTSGDERPSWLILLRDVTDRREAKKREQALASQLQHAQKLEAVGQLAGGVAHDFNNLLTVVAGYADFIEDLKEEGADEIAEELRATYQRGVVLTRQLLAFARRDVVSAMPIDVTESVRGLEKLLRRLVGESIRIEIGEGKRCPIVADAGQLDQVIINLAANARDAMPDGGALRIRTRVIGDRVVLEVSDTGSGISPEVQARIFDPFFTTKPRGKGTGLGLATVHGIVSQSGGEISVESAPGGTRFEISWPKTTREISGRTTASQATSRRQGEGMILLAEDDAHARKLIVRVLKEAGFEVLVAQDGAEALSMAVNLDRTPDLLLTDIVMPGMSGVELIERVRKLHPRLKFLLMSGYTDQQLAPAQFDLSQDLIQKPFGRQELLERVLKKLPAHASKIA